MDSFASFLKNFEDVKNHATAAASKARHFAENMSEKAQDLATVATANAKVVAERLREDAKGLTEQRRWQEAAEKAKSTLSHFSPFGSSPAQETDETELRAYGITDDFKSFVRGLDYSTFRDFDETSLPSSTSFATSEEGTLRLNPWQEKHALLALQVFEELNHLRYLLCPKRMTEEKFWQVYFSLAQPHLPENCKTGHLPNVQDSEIGEVELEEVPKSETAESANDDLDKYLQDVLCDEAKNVSEGDDEEFEDLDGYMEQLNAEMQSEQDPQNLSVDSDLLESMDGSSEDRTSGKEAAEHSEAKEREAQVDSVS